MEAGRTAGHVIGLGVDAYVIHIRPLYRLKQNHAIEKWIFFGACCTIQPMQTPTEKSTSPGWGVIVIMLLALTGVFDTAYLTIEHFQGREVGCSITNGCGEVLNSQYATIGPVPLALLGLIYYLTLVILAALWADKRNPLHLLYLQALATAGLALSLYLVYLQIFVIQAICQYCMLSAITTTLIALLSWLAIKPGTTLTRPKQSL